MTDEKNSEVIISSEDYKRGFSQAIFQVMKIIGENNDIQMKSLINLLNTVVKEINKV